MTDATLPDSRTTRVALSGVARGGTLNLVGAACNQLCLFAIISIIARELGGRAVGEYTLGWAVLVILGFVALWGFQATLNRFVAIHLADGDAARVRGVIRLGLVMSVGISMVLAGLMAVLAHPLAQLFGNLHLVTDFRLVALTLPACTLRDASLAATQGWRTQKPTALIGWVYEPVLRLLLTVVAVIAGWGVTGTFAVLPIAAWSAAIVSLFSVRRLLRRVPAVAPTVNVGAVMRFSSASLATVISSVGLVWADTVILGVLGTTQQVGVYNVATRIVNLAVFVMVPLNASLAPQLAHLLHAEDRGPLARVYKTSTRWMMALSLPPFILLLVFPRNLLHLFGSEYTGGVWVTVILALGQLANTATGPCGNLLNMSGHVRINMINNMITLVLNIGLNIVLIPPYGITGAAVAWAVSLGVVNIARVVENRVLFGVFPFDRSAQKVLLAAVMSGAVGVLARVALSGMIAELLVGALCGVVVYFAALWAFGFEDDDRAAVRSILGRTHPGGAALSEPAAIP